MVSKRDKTVSSATLILLGYELDPDQVSQALDLVPSQAWRNGENHKRLKDDGTVEVRDSVHQWGGWKLWLPEELGQMPLKAQIDHWLQMLAPRSSKVKELKAQGLTLQLNCYLSTRVYVLELPSELQTRLGDLGVDLELAIYPRIRRPNPKRYKRIHGRR